MILLGRKHFVDDDKIVAQDVPKMARYEPNNWPRSGLIVGSYILLFWPILGEFGGTFGLS